jgi:hypothetical protein
MPYDFDKLKIIYKKMGYTLINYSEKIRTEDDIEDIRKKIVNVAKYDKVIMLWESWKICKSLGMEYVMNLIKQGQNIYTYTVLNNKNHYMSVSTEINLTEAVIYNFLHQEDMCECNVCFNTFKYDEVVACPSCVFNCCEECFLNSKPDKDRKVRCFGCRGEILNLRN